MHNDDDDNVVRCICGMSSSAYVRMQFKVMILFNAKSKIYVQRLTIRKPYSWSIERRHFQWPWTTPNPSAFKVRPFFDTDMANDTAIVAMECA